MEEVFAGERRRPHLPLSQRPLRTILLLFAYRWLRLQHSSFLLRQCAHAALRWNPLQHLRLLHSRPILRRRAYFVHLSLSWSLVVVFQLDLEFWILRALLCHGSRHARRPLRRYHLFLNSPSQFLLGIRTRPPLLCFYSKCSLTRSRRRWLHCQRSQSLLIPSEHDPLILVLLPVNLHQLVQIAPWLVQRLFSRSGKTGREALLQRRLSSHESWVQISWQLIDLCWQIATHLSLPTQERIILPNDIAMVCWGAYNANRLGPYSRRRRRKREAWANPNHPYLLHSLRK